MPPLVPLPTLADNIGDSPCSIAFALRCVLRVAPLYADRPDCPADDRDAVLNAIDSIESAVAHFPQRLDVRFDPVSKRFRMVTGRFRPVIEAVIAATNATKAYEKAPDPGTFAEAEAWNAEHVWPEVVQAALKSFESGRRIRWHNREVDISSEIRRDFLIAKAEAETRKTGRIKLVPYFRRGDDKPVPPALFGLLWPDEPPIGWDSLWVPPATPSPVPPVTNPQACTTPGTQYEDPELTRGRLLKAFQRAIEDSFDQNGLSQLLRFDLGIRLDLIVLGQSFEEVVFRLLMWAEQRGRLRDLAKAVALAREQKPDVQSAANALLQIEP
jgi:hypothetical protein